MSSVHTGNRPRLYYDIASVVNPAAHYEVMDTENHYEMASNLELPALPYETPTPIVSMTKLIEMYSVTFFLFLEQVSSYHNIWKSTMGILCPNRGV